MKKQPPCNKPDSKMKRRSHYLMPVFVTLQTILQKRIKKKNKVNDWKSAAVAGVVFGLLRLGRRNDIFLTLEAKS
jgi:hypothetical protein